MKTSRIDHALFFIATFTLLLGLTAAAVQPPNRISNPSCGNFFERQQLTSIDNSAGNLMGHSVAIDNATAVVGVPFEDVGEDEDAGTVLVYTRVTPNNWVLQAQLVAPDLRCEDNEGDRFGFSVAVSGDRILVGSPYDDAYFGVSSGSACPSDEDSGSVYVFERNGTTWTQTGHWIGNEHDQLGWSVALSGDRAVTGAPGFYEKRGAIWIREKDPSGYDGWTNTGYSTAFEAAAGDRFGWSVAISGNTVIAGAPFDDFGTLAELGTAFTFKRAGLGSWYLHQQLTPFNGAAHDQLGISVAISPDEQILVAGAHYDREVFANQGSAYVYRKNGENYVYQKKLTATDARIGDSFGEVVATNGREIIVGAYSDDDTGAPDKGSAYVFKHNGISWAQTNKITASDGAAGDQFGGAVAISGTTVIVGAQANDQPGLVDIGSAYMFTCGACPTITINPATLPQGAAGALYNQTLTATGGSAPYTFSVSQGTLPPGVTLATNGAFSGVASTTGTFNFTVRATASNGCSRYQIYTIMIAGTCPTILVTPANQTLSSGFQHFPYNVTFGASGGSAPYTFGIIGGALPPGLALAVNGLLSGTTTAAGTYNFTIRAIAANNCVADKVYSLSIQTIVNDPGVKPADEQESGSTLSPDSLKALNAQQGSWSATSPLSTARSLHTATGLTNGKVLVAGGINVGNPCCTNTAIAELYDPATGQWSATGSPSTPRANHVALRLLNGKVLIASGSGNPFSQILTSSEIYDPGTGTWSAAGNLNVARQSPKATLLNDGRVLVVGGSASATAEVYDPASNAWSATGPMNSVRLIHTVTLLPNGKVLAAGGNNTRETLRSTELYDPQANSWTPTGQLINARQVHAATLLPNGKVLVSGGAPSSSGPFLAQSELYDPATGEWGATGDMTTPRVLHTLTVLPNGKVLAAAGAASNNATVKSAEVYDPATGTWAATADLSDARLNHTATLLSNGKVLVTGGSSPVGPRTSAELFDSGMAVLASVSAASFFPGAQLAPESIVAGFGPNLTTSTEAASIVPLPTELAGVSLRVRDSLSVERSASLFYASPNQINYLMPLGTATGTAIVTVVRDSAIIAGGIVEVASVAPSVFTANSTGTGLAAAQIFRVKANGEESLEPIVRFDAGENAFVAIPIDLGPPTDQVFLVLYGTGLRFRSSQAAVSVTIGSTPGEVLFADAAPGYIGLDQVNVRLSRALIGSGELNVALSADGKAANVVLINIL